MADCMAVYGLRHQRNRLAGEVSRFKHHNRRYQAEIDRLMAQIAENNARIEAMTARIETLGEAALVAFSTPLGLPVPRQTVPRKKLTEWGGITREMLKQLRAAEGNPRTTEQLAVALNNALALKLSDESLRDLQTSIRYNLKRLRNKGLVERVQSAGCVGGFASWVLAASVE